MLVASFFFLLSLGHASVVSRGYRLSPPSITGNGFLPPPPDIDNENALNECRQLLRQFYSGVSENEDAPSGAYDPNSEVFKCHKLIESKEYGSNISNDGVDNVNDYTDNDSDSSDEVDKETVMSSDDSDEIAPELDEYEFQQLLDSFPSSGSFETAPVFESNRQVQNAEDDEDLPLIHEYLPESFFNKTGQLRYSSVPEVEEELIEDLLKVIFNREDYLLLLNQPNRSQMVKAVQEMIRGPTQEVLKQQLHHKILASRATYEKFIKPLLENNKRQQLLDFAEHLMKAHEHGFLSTNDTIMLKDFLNNIAFFDRPDDEEFRFTIDKLQKVFGGDVAKTDLRSDLDLDSSTTPEFPEETDSEPKELLGTEKSPGYRRKSSLKKENMDGYLVTFPLPSTTVPSVEHPTEDQIALSVANSSASTEQVATEQVVTATASMEASTSSIGSQDTSTEMPTTASQLTDSTTLLETGSTTIENPVTMTTSNSLPTDVPSGQRSRNPWDPVYIPPPSKPGRTTTEASTTEASNITEIELTTRDLVELLADESVTDDANIDASNTTEVNLDVTNSSDFTTDDPAALTANEFVTNAANTETSNITEFASDVTNSSDFTTDDPAALTANESVTNAANTETSNITEFASDVTNSSDFTTDDPAALTADESVTNTANTETSDVTSSSDFTTDDPAALVANESVTNTANTTVIVTTEEPSTTTEPPTTTTARTTTTALPAGVTKDRETAEQEWLLTRPDLWRIRDFVPKELKEVATSTSFY